jgi:hypothetical protein
VGGGRRRRRPAGGQAGLVRLLSATICVVAFSVAIPLLAALMLINRQEAFRSRRVISVLVSIAQVVGQFAAFAGVVAGDAGS